MKKNIKISENVWRFLSLVKLRRGHRSTDQTLKEILMEDLDLTNEDLKKAMEEAGFGERGA